MNTTTQPISDIVFGWWNTGISHQNQTPEKHDEKLVFAKSVVTKLLEQGVDFLALGEVNDSDLDQLYGSSFREQYALLRGTETVGKSRFDLGFFYRPERISYVDKEFLTVRWAETNTLKTAIRIDLVPHAGDNPFVIFASHWPSDLTLKEPEERRESSGRKLREEINKLHRDFGEDGVYIIVMGDFNEEPFSEALTQQLWTTRDRGILSRKKSYLYNPFWRHLGEKRALDWNAQRSEDVCGTHYSHYGDFTRWRVIDQMMFSSNFMTSGEWFLDEQYSIIWTEHPFNFESSQKSKLDHFPIISAVAFNPSRR